MSATSAQYLTYEESVKMLRDALKRNFPGVRFSVAKSYQRGNSVRVRYTYGPTQSAVDSVAQRFHGRDFDGMTDSNSYPSSLLVGGDGALREVKHGIGFVFVNRDMPDAICSATEAALAAQWSEQDWAAKQPWDRERMAREAYSKIGTRAEESAEDAAQRAVSTNREAGSFSGRCDCRNDHNSSSGRCGVREVTDPTATRCDDAVFCEYCRDTCKAHIVATREVRDASDAQDRADMLRDLQAGK